MWVMCSANITITAEDGSNVSLVIPITVKQYAKKISVAESSVEILAGGTKQIVAQVFPADTTDQSLIYESTDEELLTVDENGLVHAHAPGSASVVIIASDQGSVSKEISFHISRLAEDIVINEDTPTEVYVGSTIKIIYDIIPSDTTKQTVSFTSSEQAIASVSSKGIVKGLSEGIVVIKISSTDGTDIEKRVSIKVIQPNETQPIITDQSAEETKTPMLSSAHSQSPGSITASEVPSTNANSTQSASILPAPNINCGVVRKIVIILGIISLILLIVFRKLWFAPILKEEEKEKEDEENKQ